MLITGCSVFNEDLLEHGGSAMVLSTYAVSGHLLSSLFENWESEFMQMSAYVVLTAYLFQRGSAKSKDPEETAAQDEDPKPANVAAGALWPVRKDGIVRTLYSYSLSIALAVLFLASFILHLRYSTGAANAEAMMHGKTLVTVLQHLASAQFWFESLQNWQSEFLSTAVIVVFTIFLRFKGSPESKPVAASHAETGS